MAYSETSVQFAPLEDETAKIGPNSVIQLEIALRHVLDAEAAEKVFYDAGHGYLLTNLPDSMVSEGVVQSLYRTLWRTLPNHEAECVAELAGRLTADYIMENRIPLFAKVFMKFLPKKMSLRFLLKAICKNAWTFVGSGECDVMLHPVNMIQIKNNPLKMPNCIWHVAVFERLCRSLVTPSANVRHLHLPDGGKQICAFEITLS